MVRPHVDVSFGAADSVARRLRARFVGGLTTLLLGASLLGVVTLGWPHTTRLRAAVAAVPGHAEARDVLRKLPPHAAAVRSEKTQAPASTASRQDDAAPSFASAAPADVALATDATATAQPSPPTATTAQPSAAFHEDTLARTTRTLTAWMPSREMLHQAWLALREGFERMRVSMANTASVGGRFLRTHVRAAHAKWSDAPGDDAGTQNEGAPTQMATPTQVVASPPPSPSPSTTSASLPPGQTPPLSPASLAASTSTALWKQGRVFEQAGQYVAAQGIFAELTRRTPGWVQPWIAYGRCALLAHRAADAEVAFRAALDREPHNPEAARYLGEALWAEGDARGAVAAFRRCIFLAPDSVHAEACRASLEESTKQR